MQNERVVRLICAFRSFQRLLVSGKDPSQSKGISPGQKILWDDSINPNIGFLFLLLVVVFLFQGMKSNQSVINRSKKEMRGTGIPGE